MRRLILAVGLILGVALTTAQQGAWEVPREYAARNVSDTVLRLVTGYRHELKR